MARPKRVSIAGDEPRIVDDGGGADQTRPGGGRDDAVLGAVGRADQDGRRHVEVVIGGWRFDTVVEDAARADLRDRATRERGGGTASGGPLEVRAIIPGRVVDVRVTADDTVEAGQAMLVVEAMKMQNELRAPRAGTVTRVAVAAGSTVEVGDLLVVLG